MRRKILSMLTAACLIVGQFTTPALAVDPAAGAAGGTEEIPQATCTCGILCEEDALDSACPVCSAEGVVLANVCKGQPEEPAAPAGECTCTQICAEGVADSTCPVCSAEGAVLTEVCKGQPEEPVIPADECTCT